MSIDEAIARERKMVEIHKNNIIPKENYHNMPWIDKENELNMRSAEEHEQLAEWLEELKTYRECNVCEYNKALDDFVRFASDMPIVEEEDGEYRPMRLEEMAEQLKAGETE